MSRRVYLLGVGLALVALALAFTDWALSLRPGVTEANVRRLRLGMRAQEVEALLGGAETWLTSDRGIVVWSGNGGTVIIVFDDRRRTEQIHVGSGPVTEPSLLDRFWSWLGW